MAVKDGSQDEIARLILGILFWALVLVVFIILIFLIFFVIFLIFFIFLIFLILWLSFEFPSEGNNGILIDPFVSLLRDALVKDLYRLLFFLNLWIILHFLSDIGQILGFFHIHCKIQIFHHHRLIQLKVLGRLSGQRLVFGQIHTEIADDIRQLELL